MEILIRKGLWVDRDNGIDALEIRVGWKPENSWIKVGILARDDCYLGRNQQHMFFDSTHCKRDISGCWLSDTCGWCQLFAFQQLHQRQRLESVNALAFSDGFSLKGSYQSQTADSEPTRELLLKETTVKVVGMKIIVEKQITELEKFDNNCVGRILLHIQNFNKRRCNLGDIHRLRFVDEPETSSDAFVVKFYRYGISSQRQHQRLSEWFSTRFFAGEAAKILEDRSLAEFGAQICHQKRTLQSSFLLHFLHNHLRVLEQSRPARSIEKEPLKDLTRLLLCLAQSPILFVDLSYAFWFERGQCHQLDESTGRGLCVLKNRPVERCE